MANAVLMASGLGTRMKPLTDKTPKPLIKVKDIPMVETIIQALIEANIAKIYIVVGYLGEQFNYLSKKYDNLKIIKNPDYKTVNNISSIYYASDVLKSGDCYICEADLYIRDNNIFKTELNTSCYFGKMVEGYSDDWVFDVDKDGYITRVGKCGNNLWNMVGISYFKAKDAGLLADLIKKRYNTQGFETLFWDNVVDENLNQLKLRINPVKQEQIFEIDTPKELESVRRIIMS